MATINFIVLKEEKQYTFIYCQSGAYLENVGYLLLTHYSNPEKLKELLELWDLIYLGEEIWGKQNDLKTRNKKRCLAYWRDMGHTRTEAFTDNSLEVIRKFINFFRNIFVYVYIYDLKKGKWFYFKHDNPQLKELTLEAIQEAS